MCEITKRKIGQNSPYVKRSLMDWVEKVLSLKKVKVSKGGLKNGYLFSFFVSDLFSFSERSV